MQLLLDKGVDVNTQARGWQYVAGVIKRRSRGSNEITIDGGAKYPLQLRMRSRSRGPDKRPNDENSARGFQQPNFILGSQHQESECVKYSSGDGQSAMIIPGLRGQQTERSGSLFDYPPPPPGFKSRVEQAGQHVLSYPSSS